jgi:hypothetical protein
VWHLESGYSPGRFNSHRLGACWANVESARQSVETPTVIRVSAAITALLCGTLTPTNNCRGCPRSPVFSNWVYPRANNCRGCLRSPVFPNWVWYFDPCQQLQGMPALPGLSRRGLPTAHISVKNWTFTLWYGLRVRLNLNLINIRIGLTGSPVSARAV